MELESALLIIPPKPVQAFAYPYREEYDPQSFARVPANITLFYPFVPPTEVDIAEAQIAAALAKHAPFQVSLDRYGSTDETLYLEPANPQPLISLYASLAGAFPAYAAPTESFSPHLTLARFKSREDRDRIELPADPSFSFMVEKLHLYVGSPEDMHAPYIPRAVIPLSGTG